MKRSLTALWIVGLACLIGTAGAQAPKEKVTAEQRCRILIGAITNADGSPFVDEKKNTLARLVAGIIGGSQGEQAVTGDFDTQCKIVIEMHQQMLRAHVVTREANIKARVAAEAEKTKVTTELNFGESLLPQAPQAKP